jgi:hypothetical protein
MLMNIFIFLSDFMLQAQPRTNMTNPFGAKPQSSIPLTPTTILVICIILGVLIVGIILFYKFIWPSIARQKQFRAVFVSLLETNNVTPDETQALIDAARRFNLTNFSIIMVSRSLVEKYFEEKISGAAGADKENLSRLLQSIRIKLFS